MVDRLAARVGGTVRAVFAGRRCVLVGGVFAGASAAVEQLLDLGVQRPVLVMCDTLGTGTLPDERDAVPVVIDVRNVSTIDTIRQFERRLVDLPAGVSVELDQFDPDRSALVLGSPFSTAATLNGRRRVGARPPNWAKWEDKTESMELLVEAGAMRVDCDVVANRTGEIARAVRRTASERGAVVAGDAAAGHSGMAEYTQWVKDSADVVALDGCDRVRVMPFVEGVPSSVHGFVLESGVAVFRPVEMVMLLDRSDRFVFAGAATFWDPPEHVTTEMRRVARRVGELMAARSGYRGAYSVDGIATADGFVATEINARWAGAFNLVARTRPDLPLFVLDHLVRDGTDSGVSAADLEDALLTSSQRARRGACYLTVADNEWEGTVTASTSTDGEPSDPASADLHLEAGPTPAGVHVRVVPDVGVVARNRPFAHLATAALEIAAQVLGTPTRNYRPQAAELA